MRAKIQSFLYVAALAAAAAGAYELAGRVADELETRTGAEVRGALSRAEIDWAWVEIDGLQAVLRGAAPDEAERFRALAAAGEVLNPLNLRDEMSVALPDPGITAQYRVEIMRNGNSILVHGLAPQNAAPDLGLLATANPGMEIADLIARSSDPVPEAWETAANLALTALDQLQMARVIFTPDLIDLDGIAPDRETALAIETQFGGASGYGLETQIDLQLPRPILSPYMTRFTLDGTGARFDTCAAESDAGRAVILEAAIAAGAPADIVCPTALGAPDPNWSQTVADTVGLITTLGGGSLTLSDLSITLSLPLRASSHPEFEAQLTAFKSTLPEIYALSVIETGGDAIAAALEGGELRFTATRSPEGLVDLRGPVGPLEARDVVQTLAHARFGDGQLHTALQAAPHVSMDWPVHVMAAVDALSHLDNGAVILTSNNIQVRGKTGDPAAADDIARALTDTLGPAVSTEVAVTYVEALDPVLLAQAPTPAECAAEINAVLEENDVRFGSGSITIDTDGFDTIGAIAEILYECPEVPMEVGGHTDSQGGAEMNQLLSQARADAVLTALSERRALVSNLKATGYGEAQPIADNATSEGREANRRIRFSLLGPNGEVIAAQPAHTEDDDPEEKAESDG
ncbi:MAG: OmpA family protein [Mangrovicoccus sp.]|nr:OmpA family protein [Mangrovicoccus sp.]